MGTWTAKECSILRNHEIRWHQGKMSLRFLHYARSSAKCSSHQLGRNIRITLLIVFMLGLLPALIVRGLILVIRGFPLWREFPHPQPGGRAGWPEEGTPGWLGCTTEGHSEGESLDGGSRTHCRRDTLMSETLWMGRGRHARDGPRKAHQGWPEEGTPD